MGPAIFIDGEGPTNLTVGGTISELQWAVDLHRRKGWIGFRFSFVNDAASMGPSIVIDGEARECAQSPDAGRRPASMGPSIFIDGEYVSPLSSLAQ